MSQVSENAAVVANAIQLSSDIILQVLGPDVAHRIGDEEVTSGALKSLVKAEIMKTNLVKEVA